MKKEQIRMRCIVLLYALMSSFLCIAAIEIPIGFIDRAHTLVEQPDEFIVVAGESDDRFALIRIDRLCTLDPTFGTGGIVTTPIGLDAVGFKVLLQPDGKIILVGGATVGGLLNQQPLHRDYHLR